MMMMMVIIEVFRYLSRLRRYKRKSVEVGVFEGGGSLSLKFRSKGYLSRQYGPLYTGMAYYNFAAGSFHHTKKLCDRLYSIEVDFYSNNEKIAFCATLK